MNKNNDSICVKGNKAPIIVFIVFGFIFIGMAIGYSLFAALKLEEFPAPAIAMVAISSVFGVAFFVLGIVLCRVFDKLIEIKGDKVIAHVPLRRAINLKDIERIEFAKVLPYRNTSKGIGKGGGILFTLKSGEKLVVNNLKNAEEATEIIRKHLESDEQNVL